MKHIVLTALTLFATTAAQAETCPEAPLIDPQMDSLFVEMQRAPDGVAVRPLTARMWALLLEAPDVYSQELLDSAMERMRVADHAAAEAALTSLTQYCPFYAEGFNQRAFSHFLRGQFPQAEADLARTLDLNPRHIGALTGMALTLIHTDRTAEAQPYLRRALDLNPWLSERALLTGRDL